MTDHDDYDPNDDIDDYDDERDAYDSPDGDSDDGEFIDPEAELPPVQHVVELAPRPQEAPRVQLTPTQARQAMEELLEEFEDEGRTVVGPADFMEHCDRHGRSRSWVSGQVAQYVMAGRLAETREPGRYTIVPQPHAA